MGGSRHIGQHFVQTSPRQRLVAAAAALLLVGGLLAIGTSPASALAPDGCAALNNPANDAFYGAVISDQPYQFHAGQVLKWTFKTPATGNPTKAVIKLGAFVADPAFPGEYTAIIAADEAVDFSWTTTGLNATWTVSCTQPPNAVCDEFAPVPAGYKVKTGSPGDDFMFSLSGNTVFFAGPGNDTVMAGSGNDIICGGDGNDNLNGGPGNDIIVGGAGQDDLKGGSGTDIGVDPDADTTRSSIESNG